MQRETSRRAVNKHLHLKINSKRDFLKTPLPASPAVLPGSLGSRAQPCGAGEETAPDGTARRIGFLVRGLNRKVGENPVLAELE